MSNNFEEVVDDFIERTYNIWKSGTLTQLIPKTKEKADSMSYFDFKKYINRIINYSISLILEKTSLLDDEYYVSGIENGKSFIVTNQRLFISSQNDFKKGFDIICLKDINTIDFKNKWEGTGSITLLSGQVLKYTKLDYYNLEEFLLKLKSIYNSNFNLDSNNTFTNSIDIISNEVNKISNKQEINSDYLTNINVNSEYETTAKNKKTNWLILSIIICCILSIFFGIKTYNAYTEEIAHFVRYEEGKGQVTTIYTLKDSDKFKQFLLNLDKDKYSSYVDSQLDFYNKIYFEYLLNLICSLVSIAFFFVSLFLLLKNFKNNDFKTNV